MTHLNSISLFISFMFIILFSTLLNSQDLILETSQPQKPTWVDSTIIENGQFVYTIGHSQAQASEEDAKEQALAQATEEVVRYSGVTVESFSRSVDASSMKQGKEYYTSDFETQSRIRARAFVRRSVPVDWYIRKMSKKKEVYYLASVKLRVPIEEIERIQEEKEIKLSLDIGIYYQDDQGRLQYLNEGHVLHSGDGYALYARPSDPCCLYIYQVDDLNRAFRLFPNPDFNTLENPVQPGVDCWIPNLDQVFYLDETTGKEKFYVFASPDAIVELAGNVELKEADLDRQLKTMGVGGLKDKTVSYNVAPPKRVQVAEVKKKLQAEGAFVWETWFWHR